VVDEKRTKVTNYMINDYKGNVPKVILNMGAPVQSTVFNNIRKAMKEFDDKGEL